MDKKYMIYGSVAIMFILVLVGVYAMVNAVKSSTFTEQDCKTNYIAKADVNVLINLTNRLINLTNICYAQYNVSPLSYMGYYKI